MAFFLPFKLLMIVWCIQLVIDKASSESHHGSQHANTSIVVTAAITVTVLVALAVGGVVVMLWCCYKPGNNGKEDDDTIDIIEEDSESSESKTVISDNPPSSESFPSSEQPQNNQLVTQSIPYCDCEPPSVMIPPSSGTVINDCYQPSLANEYPPLSIQEDGESPKINRKMGVTSAVSEGEDVSGDNESAEETTVRRKRWYRRIKPKTHSSCHDPNSKTSKVNLQHSTSSTASLKIRFNRFIGRSYSLIPKQQVHVNSASLIPTNSKLKKGHTFSASNI